jgi:hypothetical protein
MRRELRGYAQGTRSGRLAPAIIPQGLPFGNSRRSNQIRTFGVRLEYTAQALSRTNGGLPNA